MALLFCNPYVLLDLVFSQFHVYWEPVRPSISTVHRSLGAPGPPHCQPPSLRKSEVAVAAQTLENLPLLIVQHHLVQSVMPGEASSASYDLLLSPSLPLSFLFFFPPSISALCQNRQEKSS